MAVRLSSFAASAPSDRQSDRPLNVAGSLGFAGKSVSSLGGSFERGVDA
jgi:hypothetical protein